MSFFFRSVFKLEGQIAEVYPQVVLQENFKKQVEGFHEELLSWCEPKFPSFFSHPCFSVVREQRVAKESLNASKIEKQEDAIKLKDELVDGMQVQIQTLNEKIMYDTECG
jgi:hypothetical protein